MAKNETFVVDKHYANYGTTVAKASAGRASRVSAPLYQEERALLDKEWAELEEKRAELEEKSAKLEEEKAIKKERPRPPQQKTATYRIGQRLVDRVDEAAHSYNVEKGSFVKALLIYALDELEAGSWKLPPVTGVRKLDV